MKLIKILLFSLAACLLLSCSPVKNIARDQYKLSSFSAKQVANHPRRVTLTVSLPDAAAGYQTQQMLYTKKPFQIEAFANNVWTSPPGDMIYPLIMQSLQRSGYFFAVTSAAYNDEAHYRLDTQLLQLQQNFLRKPSILEFSAKVVLTNLKTNEVVASRIISHNIPCLQDSPYGGVIAANKAVLLFTANVTEFVISYTKQG